MKKKMLIIGITMAAAGSEKSFLSFCDKLDSSEWDVTLLLAKKTGDFLPFVPRWITVREMDDGEIFLIDKENAKKIIFNKYIMKNPLRAFGVLGSCLDIALSRGDKRVYAKNRLWLKVMESMPEQDGDYDAAVAYWGDRTMFYMTDKVSAARKITWLHFDFDQPPRDEKLYEQYFLQCDKVVTVSEKIRSSLVSRIPSVADRVLTIENFIDREKILRLSKESVDFHDGFKGLRILTVGRVCEQKGYDLALPAIARLIREGFDIKWYVLGTKNDEYASQIERQLASLGIKDRVIYLGTSGNPYKYMRACDIYVQPSRHEGKPISVEEAKVLCKPIFVTAYSAADEQLAGGRFGVIGDVSEEGIYGGIKKLLSDPELRDSLSKALSSASENDNGAEEIRRLLDD